MKKTNLIYSTFPFLLVGLLTLSGCAGGSKKTSANGEPTSEAASDSSPALDENGEPVPSAKGNDAAASSSVPQLKKDVSYKALAQAVRAGNTKGVTDETSHILAQNSSDPVALNALGLMYLRRGKPGAAKLVLNRAIEKNQSVAALYNNLGATLLEEGEVAAAVVQFKKALKADPNHAEANANLGCLYASGADFAKARPLLEIAYRANKGNVAVANDYGIVLRAAKDYDNAKRVYEDAIKVNNRDPALMLNYAILLVDYMNQPKEGLEALYKVEFLSSDRKDVLAKVNALEKKAKSEVK